MIKESKKAQINPKVAKINTAQIPPPTEFVEYIERAINIYGFLAPGISSQISSNSTNFSSEILKISPTPIPLHLLDKLIPIPQSMIRVVPEYRHPKMPYESR